MDLKVTGGKASSADTPGDKQNGNPKQKNGAPDLHKDAGFTSANPGFQPLKFLWLLVAGIFLAEVVAMLATRFITPLEGSFEVILDALIMTTLVFPMVYFLSFRPLMAEITRSHHAEAALQHAHDEMELRVEQRSQELKSALHVSQQRQTEVEALLQSARAILEQREFPIVARAIFDECKSLIGATAGYVALLEGENNDPLFLDSGGLDCVVDQSLPMPIRGLREQAFSSGKTVYENAFLDSDWTQFLPEGHVDLINVLFSPLKIIDEVVGLMGLANKPENFNTEDVKMATAFGELAAIALINSRAEERLMQARDELELRVIERTQELEQANELLQAEIGERKLIEIQLQKNYEELLTLNSASQALSQTLNLETVIDTLMEHMGKIVPYDHSSVFLLEGETFLSERARRINDHQMDMSHDLGKSIEAQSYPYIEKLLDQQNSVLIADMNLHPDWQPLPASQGTRSWLGVPLIAGNKTLGVYILEKQIPNFYTQEHINLAETLAGQASTAIQNAWLYEQVKAGRERLQTLSHRLVEIQESERRYIARELHDEAGQSLASLMVILQLIERGADQPELVLDEVAKMEQILLNIQENLHRLAMALRPASLDHLGLVSALRQHVEAVSETHNLEVQIEASAVSNQMPDTVQTVLYRIVQEALTNVVRHTQASKVDVLLKQRDDKLILVVEDDGAGFDWQAALQKNRLGLHSMRERAEMVGGNLLIESAPGKGTTIVVEIPYVNSHIDR